MDKKTTTINIKSCISKDENKLILEFNNTGVDLNNKKHCKAAQDIARSIYTIFTLIGDGHDIDEIFKDLN